MPRQARIDAPGALHHIICRGIERKRIFYDNADRDDFVKRFSFNYQTPHEIIYGAINGVLAI